MPLYTHVQRLQLDTHHGIVLIRGRTGDGDSIYAYVKVDRQDIDDIEMAYNLGKEVDYSRYKGIIKHDWGEEPPENVKIYMEKHYGFSHESAA